MTTHNELIIYDIYRKGCEINLLLMSYIHTYVIIQNAGFDNIRKSTDYMINVLNLPMTEYMRYHESLNII